MGGGGNTITAGGPGNLNAGFNFFGSNNQVSAGPGPFALAGTILRDGLTVIKNLPGFAINDTRVGGASTTRSQTTTSTNNATATNASTKRAATNDAGTTNTSTTKQTTPKSNEQRASGPSDASGGNNGSGGNGLSRKHRGQ